MYIHSVFAKTEQMRKLTKICYQYSITIFLKVFCVSIVFFIMSLCLLYCVWYFLIKFFFLCVPSIEDLMRWCVICLRIFAILLLRSTSFYYMFFTTSSSSTCFIFFYLPSLHFCNFFLTHIVSCHFFLAISSLILNLQENNNVQSVYLWMTCSRIYTHKNFVLN